MKSKFESIIYLFNCNLYWIIFRQGTEWLEIRDKVEDTFNQISSTFFTKIDTCCNELITRICKIRNRQNEVRIKRYLIRIDINHRLVCFNELITRIQVPVSFYEDLIRWAMECFCDLTFNKRLGFLEPIGYNSSSEASKLINALTTAHKYMSRCETGFQVWRFFLTPFARKLFEACDVLDK